MTATNESYLVVGGDGFLGACIVRMLVERGERLVAVLDIAQTQRFDDGVQVHVGDITVESNVVEAVQKVRLSACSF